MKPMNCLMKSMNSNKNKLNNSKNKLNSKKNCIFQSMPNVTKIYKRKKKMKIPSRKRMEL